jgi:hypothetical protein
MWFLMLASLSASAVEDDGGCSCGEEGIVRFKIYFTAIGWIMYCEL